MNTFGRMFGISIFGESHGECAGIIVDGCPSGIKISANDFHRDLERRKGWAKGTTARKEEDVPLIKSGIFNGKTTGAPILILFSNMDVDSTMYEKFRFMPRPGHADLVAMQKFGGFNDYRGGGHFSGRLTVGVIAAGVIAKNVIQPVKVNARVLEVGGITDINTAIEEAIKRKNSVGGIIECRAKNLPPGLGEPFFDSVESLLSHAVFSIPGIKGIEFGAGFFCSKMYGSEYNDIILNAEGKTKTNNSGGINGGLTNGNELLFRVAVRPTASIPRTQRTIDVRSGKKVNINFAGRQDTCIALRVPVILEAMTAIVLADLMLIEQKIGRITR